MSKTEIEQIAKATAEWLTEKKKRKQYEGLFSESHLVIPVADYLIDHGWSALRTEQHSKTLFELGEGGDVNYDLEATKDDGSKLLVEMKLQKKVSDPRLFKDFAKLALPPTSFGYTSLCLIAESAVAPSKSKVIQELSIKATKCRFHLSLIKDAVKNEDYVEVTQVANGITQNTKNICSLKGDELKSVRKIMNIAPPLSEFTVECAANETVGNDRVIILRVGR